MRTRLVVLSAAAAVALAVAGSASGLSVRLVSPGNGARVAAQGTYPSEHVEVHFVVDPSGCFGSHPKDWSSVSADLRVGGGGQAPPAHMRAYPGTGRGWGYIATPTISLGSGGNVTYYWYVTVTCRTRSGAYLRARSQRWIIHVHG